VALGLLYALLGDGLFDRDDLGALHACNPRERHTIQTMLVKKLNTPLTSSAGRLFDAVASLIGLRQVSSFEGQAAMELEFAVHGIDTDERYPFRIQTEPAITVIDWAPLIVSLLADYQAQVPSSRIAARFHNTLVEIIVAIARDVGETTLVFTGGCFQNRYLTERAVERLRAEGFRPFWHQRVPPNDGGIALGQLVARRRQPIEEKPTCV
jgi:hydrogenase maturation protein HypF